MKKTSGKLNHNKVYTYLKKMYQDLHIYSNECFEFCDMNFESDPCPMHQIQYIEEYQFIEKVIDCFADLNVTGLEQLQQEYPQWMHIGNLEKIWTTRTFDEHPGNLLLCAMTGDSTINPVKRIDHVKRFFNILKMFPWNQDFIVYMDYATFINHIDQPLDTEKDNRLFTAASEFFQMIVMLALKHPEELTMVNELILWLESRGYRFTLKSAENQLNNSLIQYLWLSHIKQSTKSNQVPDIVMPFYQYTKYGRNQTLHEEENRNDPSIEIPDMPCVVFDYHHAIQELNQVTLADNELFGIEILFINPNISFLDIFRLLQKLNCSQLIPTPYKVINNPYAVEACLMVGKQWSDNGHQLIAWLIKQLVYVTNRINLDLDEPFSFRLFDYQNEVNIGQICVSASGQQFKKTQIKQYMQQHQSILDIIDWLIREQSIEITEEYMNEILIRWTNLVVDIEKTINDSSLQVNQLNSHLLHKLNENVMLNTNYSITQCNFFIQYIKTVVRIAGLICVATTNSRLIDTQITFISTLYQKMYSLLMLSCVYQHYVLEPIQYRSVMVYLQTQFMSILSVTDYSVQKIIKCLLFDDVQQLMSQDEFICDRINKNQLYHKFIELFDTYSTGLVWYLRMKSDEISVNERIAYQESDFEDQFNFEIQKMIRKYKLYYKKSNQSNSKIIWLTHILNCNWLQLKTRDLTDVETRLDACKQVFACSDVNDIIFSYLI